MRTQKRQNDDKWYDPDSFLCAAAYLASRGYILYVDFDETNAWTLAIETYQRELSALEGKPN